ncbi:hypothetical protein [Pseudobutyrivibrio ruminis]|uniref:hypothetical protein n=1 Tax=Pseudobutyrivibrio ruminis TaxID=46206 RepID=UPI000408AAB2|nr:hypothetical protein [Pseudobutyrivibrio ruminis]
MKKINKNPLIILAIGLVVIIASTVGATRAAMVAQEDADSLKFTTAEFKVDFTGDISDGKIDFPAMEEDEFLKIGKLYNETISVKNTSTGEYDEYLRVVVKKSWEKDGKKTIALDPKKIEIKVADGWYKNVSESTAEQDVYYKLTPVKKDAEIAFITGIKVKEDVAKVVEQTGTETIIENSYPYNKAKIKLSLEVDGLQTHNSADSIRAAWGLGQSFEAEDSEGNKTTVSFEFVD